MKSMILAFLRDEEGLTTVEYAIAGGLIAGGVIAAFDALGVSISGVIDQISAALDGIDLTP